MWYTHSKGSVQISGQQKQSAIIWAAKWENVPYDMCAQWKLRLALTEQSLLAA